MPLLESEVAHKSSERGQYDGDPLQDGLTASELSEAEEAGTVVIQCYL